MTRFALLFGGIWVLVGAGLTVGFTLGGGPIWDDWILDRRGAEALAQPLGVESTASTRDWQRIYRVRFRFVDLAGETHEAEGGTSDRALVSKAEAGEELLIEYDPQAPGQRVRLAGESASFFGMVILVPVGFVVAGLVILLLGYRGLRRTRALYRAGTTAQGRVVVVAPTSMRINKRRVMLVTYEFHHPSGPAQGTWRTTDPPQAEDPIWVIYDPQNADRSMAVPP